MLWDAAVQLFDQLLRIFPRTFLRLFIKPITGSHERIVRQNRRVRVMDRMRRVVERRARQRVDRVVPIARNKLSVCARVRVTAPSTARQLGVRDMSVRYRRCLSGMGRVQVRRSFEDGACQAVVVVGGDFGPHGHLVQVAAYGTLLVDPDRSCDRPFAYADFSLVRKLLQTASVPFIAVK